MPTKKIKKKFNFPKKDLINIVLDISKYKEFLPWCKNSIIINIIKKRDKVIIVADLEIGYKFVCDTYGSKVIYDKKKSEIVIIPLHGPIKKLFNIWKFKEISKKSCEIDFFIEIQLNNSLLNSVFEKFFEIGFEKILSSFEDRAKKLII